MAWFNRNKLPRGDTEKQHDHRVEVVVHQNARKEVIDEALRANKLLKSLLEDNGFTLKIYLATGGKVKKKVAHNGH